MNNAFEDRLSERKAFEVLLIESAELALRGSAEGTSCDEANIAAALPSLATLKARVAGALATHLEASGERLQVDVPISTLVSGGAAGLDASGAVDIVTYDAASETPVRLIQLLKAPTNALFETSLKLSLLRGALRGNLPDAFELLFTDGHTTEQAANEVLGDLVQTSMQGFEASRVLRFRDPSAQNDMFVGLTVARVLHAD